jgi:predicted transcriptional regulator
MGLKCVLCGLAHLPSERCGADTEAGLAASAKLDRARAALARVEAPVAKEAFKEAAVHGQAFVKDGRVLKREEVLAAPKAEGFDRNAYHKTYMKDYMRGWRARKKAGP